MRWHAPAMTRSPLPSFINRRRAIQLGAALALAGLAACNSLRTFDAFVPKDRGTRRTITSAAFGADSRQTLDVYRPAGADGRLPILVFFYGGSWNSGSKSGYSWLGRALAAQGFVTVIPDYRLARKAPFPAFLEDGAAAVRWAIAHAAEIGGDPQRIIIAGHSAGAYNAAMLAYDERWLGRDKALVKGFIGLAGPYDFLHYASPVTDEVFGSVPDKPSTQPVNHVGPGDPPAFIGTAAGDQTVHPSNATSMTAKLRAAGVRVERRSYAHVGHVGILIAIARPLRGRAGVLEDMVRFAREATSQASRSSGLRPAQSPPMSRPRRPAGVRARSSAG